MLGVLLGLALGYGLGRLSAPASGAQMRREPRPRVQEKGSGAVEMGREHPGEVRRQAIQSAFQEAASRAAGQRVVNRSRRA